MGKKQNLSTKIGTLKNQGNRLLDPDNDSITLKTLQNAAEAIGAHLEMKLVFDKSAA